jgi:hypothetical protein
VQRAKSARWSLQHYALRHSPRCLPGEKTAPPLHPSVPSFSSLLGSRRRTRELLDTKTLSARVATVTRRTTTTLRGRTDLRLEAWGQLTTQSWQLLLRRSLQQVEEGGRGANAPEGPANSSWRRSAPIAVRASAEARVRRGPSMVDGEFEYSSEMDISARRRSDLLVVAGAKPRGCLHSVVTEPVEVRHVPSRERTPSPLSTDQA